MTVFGIYRKTTAHWADGTVKSLYVKTKGQGSEVLIETADAKEPIKLGDQYGLTLDLIAEGTPMPPIELPEFPELPDNSLPESPGIPTQPIYKPVYPDNSLPQVPGVPTHPIYLPPQVQPPIYLPPQVQPPIYLPPTAGQLPWFPPSYPVQLPWHPPAQVSPPIATVPPEKPSTKPVEPDELEPTPQ